MKQEILETWTARKAADEARHLASCAVCRNSFRPATDEKLYAVKNSRTREFVHILVNGESLESKLGWSHDEILYSMLIEDGAPKGPTMTKEVKARLREASEKRKTENKLKRLVRANTPARLVEGEQEETMTRKSKKKKSKGGRMFVFDIPVTKVLLWMGREGFKSTGATVALEVAGVTKMPTEGTIRVHLGLGKTKKFASKIAKLTTEQQKILRDAAQSATVQEKTQKADKIVVA